VSLGVTSTGLSLAHLAPILLFTRLAGAACTPVDHAHAAWTTILGRFVRAGEVAYGRLGREGAPLLASYLDGLSSDARTITRAGAGPSASPSGSTPTTHSR